MRAYSRVLTRLVALTALLVCIPVGASGHKAKQSRPITQQQADDILNELKQIRLLLEKIEKDNALRTAAKSAADEHVKVRIDDGYFLGHTDAPLTLVEFADYQCPFCRHFHATTFPELRRNYIETGKLRYVALDLPLDFHRDASKAAVSALCAGEQYKFWEMRDLLLSSVSNLTQDAILSYAQQLQLDLPVFRTCVESDKYLPKIKRDRTQADSVGISGTPTFVLGKTAKGEIEGVRIIGAVPYSEFDVKIKQLLSDTR